MGIILAMVPPTGAITMYGGTTAPNGWLLCDGSAISRTTYAKLFEAYGTTYGAGNGSTTFNIPDMRGIYPKGAGTTNREAGKNANGSFYSGTLGAYSQDRIQGHRHTAIGSALYAGVFRGINAPLATDVTGGGQAHPNIQPTLIGYMWERTA